MTQLILDVDGVAVALPESQNGGYTAYEEDLSTDIVMSSGRMVKELGGTVWIVNYKYGWFSDADKARVISACRKGRRTPILCSFLKPEGGEASVSSFWVTAFTEPKFMWSSGGNPMWADFSVSLREVRPHG